LGQLMNQNRDVCAESAHWDRAAFDYWVRRGRKPVTNIKWPLDLTTRPTITVTPKTTTTEKPKISIVRKSPEQQPVKKITIIKK